MLKRIHHVAVICSNYGVSKRFYTEVLGLVPLAEAYRAERDSYKLDLALPDGGRIELFTFPGAPARPSYPEARGLRHLAFEVDDVQACAARLRASGVAVEALRTDEATGRRFVFFADPDGLPLELYECASPGLAPPSAAEAPAAGALALVIPRAGAARERSRSPDKNLT